MKDKTSYIPHFGAGSPRELGSEMGTAFQEKYNAARPIFWKMADLMGHDKDRMLTDAKHQLDQFRTLKPNTSENIDGISEATGIPGEEFLALGTVGFELFKRIPKKETFMHFGGCCTNGAAAPPATKDGQTYLTWSFDLGYIWKMISPFIFQLYVVDVPGSYKYVALGLPGVFGSPMLNEKGLGAVYTTAEYVMNPECNKGPGIVFWQWMDMAFRTCSNVRDLARLAEGVERESSTAPYFLVALFTGMNLVAGDALGGIVKIEYTHDHVATVFGMKSIVANANHHAWLDWRKTGAAAPSFEKSPKAYPGSWHREETMYRWLKENHGKIDLQKVLNEMTQLHETGQLKTETPIGGYDAVCHHCYDQYCRRTVYHESGFACAPGPCGTLFYYVVQPKEFTIWFCPGHPCRYDWVPLRFGPVFGAGIPSPEVRANCADCARGISLGNLVKYEIEMANVGAYDTIDLSANAPDEGWKVELKDGKFVVSSDVEGYEGRCKEDYLSSVDIAPSSFAIPGGSSVKAKVLLTVPVTAGNGEHRVTVKAVSRNDLGKSSSLVLKAVIGTTPEKESVIEPPVVTKPPALGPYAVSYRYPEPCLINNALQIYPGIPDGVTETINGLFLWQILMTKARDKKFAEAHGLEPTEPAVLESLLEGINMFSVLPGMIASHLPKILEFWDQHGHCYGQKPSKMTVDPERLTKVSKDKELERVLKAFGIHAEEFKGLINQSKVELARVFVKALFGLSDKEIEEVLK